jgi:hypothetical protein
LVFEDFIHGGAPAELALFFAKEFSWAVDEIQMINIDKKTQIQRTSHLVINFQDWTV